MDERKSKAELSELPKKHAKPCKEMPEAVREFFTEDKRVKQLLSNQEG